MVKINLHQQDGLKLDIATRPFSSCLQLYLTVSGFLLDEGLHFVLVKPVKTIATPKGKYYYTFRVIWEDAINLTGFWDPKFILLKWEIPDFSWDSKCEKDTRFSLTIQSGLFFR